MIENDEFEADKNRLIAASFTAWQMGVAGKIGFHEYIRKLGLVEKDPELTPEQKQKLFDEVFEMAEKVKAVDLKNA